MNKTRSQRKAFDENIILSNCFSIFTVLNSTTG